MDIWPFVENGQEQARPDWFRSKVFCFECNMFALCSCVLLLAATQSPQPSIATCFKLAKSKDMCVSGQSAEEVTEPALQGQVRVRPNPNPIKTEHWDRASGEGNINEGAQ